MRFRKPHQERPEFVDYRELCTAWAYLDNRLSAMERHIGMSTNNPRPSLGIVYQGHDVIIKRRPRLKFGDFPSKDIY